uniref:Glutaredoxin domain-containing protein n=1 Tax=viral metagenome TaxID=1070528 RepID=A0A6C0IWD6_9ZZZZ
MSKPVLFYSPNCKYCINLWKDLKQQNLLDKIIKLNINNTTVPKYIKSVPTLIVEGREPLQGNAINMYFNTFNIEKKPSVNNNFNNNQKNDNIQDYLPGEMSNSWSDNYSYIDNTNPIKHTYSFLGNKSIDSNISLKPKVDNTNLNRKLEDYQKERNMNIFKG